MLGGVANHYFGLARYWSQDVKYLQVGRRGKVSRRGLYWLPWDIVRFIIKILFFNPDVVVLNPSLGGSAIRRDFIFHRIARLLGKPVTVFFHGFNEDTIPHLDLGNIVHVLNQSACVFVLAERFREIMQSWGVRVPIHLSTTKVDNLLLENFCISTRSGHVKNILFLARVTEAKGIFIALQCYRLLKEKYHELCFHVVGDGPALESARKFVFDNDIKDVFFYGALAGEEVAKAYSSADIYLFPTYHEGMPTSVLEAMAFGLPVVTRPVGGLVDFFVNGKMGEMVESLDPHDFSAALIKYIDAPDLAKEVACYNYDYANKHFLASSVARCFEMDVAKSIGVEL